MTVIPVTSVALLVLLLPAVLIDVRQHRIPNPLVFTFWLVGPALHLLTGGTDALATSASGLLLALGLTLPLWLVGWFGAGDVKLIAAIGGLLGSSLVWPLLAAVAICGAALAVVALAARGALGRSMERLKASMALSMASRRGVYIEAQGEDAQIRLPYAIAIATGTAVVWLHHINVIALLH